MADVDALAQDVALVKGALGAMLRGNIMWREALASGAAVFQLDDAARSDTSAAHGEFQVYRDSSGIYLQVWDRESAAWRTFLTSSVAFGAIGGQIDIGDAAGNGSNATASRSDHQHAFPAPGAGYPLDVAAAEADGTATTPARSDHVHAHGSGYLADAHHAQAHGASDHTNRPGAADIPLGSFVAAAGSPAFVLSGAQQAAWAFDAASDEAIAGSLKVPSDYASGGSVRVIYRMAAATSGSIKFRVNLFEAIEGVGGEGAGTNVDTTDAVQGTAANWGIFDVAMGLTLTAGAHYRVYVVRLASDIADDAAGDMHLVGLALIYTADQ